MKRFIFTLMLGLVAFLCINVQAKAFEYENSKDFISVDFELNDSDFVFEVNESNDLKPIPDREVLNEHPSSMDLLYNSNLFSKSFTRYLFDLPFNYIDANNTDGYRNQTQKYLIPKPWYLISWQTKV